MGPAPSRLVANIYMNKYTDVNPSSHSLLKIRKDSKVVY